MAVYHQLSINGKVPQHQERIRRFGELPNEQRHRVLRFAGNNDHPDSIFGPPQIDLRSFKRTLRVPLRHPVSGASYATLRTNYLRRFDQALDMPAEALAPTFGEDIILAW